MSFHIVYNKSITIQTFYNQKTSEIKMKQTTKQTNQKETKECRCLSVLF